MLLIATSTTRWTFPGSDRQRGPIGTCAGNEDAYIGHVDVSGKRVLKIGPASRYMSFYMESRGAEVVSVELSPELDWDVVPDAHLDFGEFARNRVVGMEGLRNGYWFAHERLHSKARVHYGSAYEYRTPWVTSTS